MFENLSDMIARNGIEHIVFHTVTFAENLTDRVEAQRRFHSYCTGFLKQQFLEFIAAVERQSRGAIHYHIIGAVAWDAREGFDFEACRAAVAAKKAGNFPEFKRLERVYFRSANQALRDFWELVRKTAPDYHLGRCETLPILSNSAALARYVGAYVGVELRGRMAWDKGLRTLRYSLARVPVNMGTESEPKIEMASLRKCGGNWRWAAGSGLIWRRGCQVLSLVLGETDFTTALGKRWAWNWGEDIAALGRNYETCLAFVEHLGVVFPDTVADAVARASKMAECCREHEKLATQGGQP